jgi:glucokinase
MILAADIGGTSARFRLVEGGEHAASVCDAVLAVANHASFDAAMGTFLREHGSPGRVAAACIAVAGPIAGRRARLTNGEWTFDADQIAARFDIEHVDLVNDFEANASGVETLAPESMRTLQAGDFDDTAPRLIIGAGTGLGVSYSIRCPDGRRVVPGEGGHIGFAPANNEQIALLQFLQARLGRVSVEHVVSGPGLVRLYEFACLSSEGRGKPPARDVESEGAAAVVRRAVEGNEPAAARAVDLFIECYGAIAGDHALSILARGGVFLCGGIAPKLLERISMGGFLAAFHNKGSHARLMAQFPVHVVVDEQLGLSGAARLALIAAREHQAGERRQGERK